eukprot:224030-Prorocentrum_minimum.AAC.1
MTSPAGLSSCRRDRVSGVECTLAVIGTGGIVKQSNAIILMADQSDAGHEGIFSWRTNRTQDTR